MAHRTLIPAIFMGVFAAVAGSFIYKAFKYGGFKAAPFGAPIARTLGEVSGVINPHQQKTSGHQRPQRLQ